MAKIVEIKFVGTNLNIKLAGSIYNDETSYFKQLLTSYLTQDITTLSLDLSKIRYIDPAGIGALLYIKRLSLEKGKVFEIDSASDIVSELFAVNHLKHLLPIKNSVVENEVLERNYHCENIAY